MPHFLLILAMRLQRQSPLVALLPPPSQIGTIYWSLQTRHDHLLQRTVVGSRSIPQHFNARFALSASLAPIIYGPIFAPIPTSVHSSAPYAERHLLGSMIVNATKA